MSAHHLITITLLGLVSVGCGGESSLRLQPTPTPTEKPTHTLSIESRCLDWIDGIYIAACEDSDWGYNELGFTSEDSLGFYDVFSAELTQGCYDVLTFSRNGSEGARIELGDRDLKIRLCADGSSSDTVRGYTAPNKERPDRSKGQLMIENTCMSTFCDVLVTECSTNNWRDFIADEDPLRPGKRISFQTADPGCYGLAWRECGETGFFEALFYISAGKLEYVRLCGD